MELFMSIGRVVQLEPPLLRNSMNQIKIEVVRIWEKSGKSGSSLLKSKSMPVPGFGPNPMRAGMRYQ